MPQRLGRLPSRRRSAQGTVPEGPAQSPGDGGNGAAPLELPVSDVPQKLSTIDQKMVVARALWNTDYVPLFLHELVQYQDVAVSHRFLTVRHLSS